jgi:hypothetical protein
MRSKWATLEEECQFLMRTRKRADASSCTVRRNYAVNAVFNNLQNESAASDRRSLSRSPHCWRSRHGGYAPSGAQDSPSEERNVSSRQTATAQRRRWAKARKTIKSVLAEVIFPKTPSQRLGHPPHRSRKSSPRQSRAGRSRQLPQLYSGESQRQQG